MSWTPTIWILRTDFDVVKKKLIAIEDLPSLSMFEMSIAGRRGVVIHADDNDISRRFYAVHEVIERAGMPHWLIDGEGRGCEACQTFGDKIDADDIRMGID